MGRGDRYERVAAGIAGYLAERQGADGSLPGPDHYGVAFSLWLWSHFGGDFAPQIERAWGRLEGSPPDTHGEFNAYALLQCRDRMGPAVADGLLRRIRFGRRHSANWMLLRAACAAHPGPYCSRLLCGLEARAALLCHARRCFIHDRPRVRSLAYHVFSGALLADIWQHQRKRWAGRAAARAAHVVAPFVLPNGDSLYVGRGQEQIFGYGALLYLLEAAARITGRQDFGVHADRVFQYLVKFQRTDGSFPLVLHEGEELDPWGPDASRPGWYSYNRYADYLPLLGCFLLKAAAPGVEPLPVAVPSRRPKAFRIWERDRYVAVLSGPGGSTTNDLAFPYVCVDGESLFPCYGAESARVRPEAMPLPYGQIGVRPYSFREQLSYRLTRTGLIGASRLVRHLRHFEFAEDGFRCEDEMMFRRRGSFSSFVPANFLFRNLRALPERGFETWHGKVRARVELIPAGRAYPTAATTASGALAALRCTRGEFRPRAGETISTELRVRFL